MTQPAIDPATLAAWESVHTLNLDPHLTAEQSIAFWAAVVAFREDQDADALAEAIHAIKAEASPRVRVLLDTALANLPTAAAPAQES